MQDARRPPGPAPASSPRHEAAQGGATLSAAALQFLGSVAGISVWTWCTGDDRVYHAGLNQPDTIGQGLLMADLVRQIHPNDRRRVLRRLRAAAERHEAGTLRFRGPVVDGQAKHLSATLFPQFNSHDRDHIQIIVQDVTRAALAEQALKRSEEHYRNSVALNPEVPWLADAEGRITEVGPRWIDLVGLTVEQTLGDGWTTALHPDDVPGIMPIWQHSIRTGEPVDVEYRIRTVSGEYRWMRARAAAHRNRRGEITRW